MKKDDIVVIVKRDLPREYVIRSGVLVVTFSFLEKMLQLKKPLREIYEQLRTS